MKNKSGINPLKDNQQKPVAMESEKTRKFNKRLVYSAIFTATSLFAIFWAPLWFFILTIEAFVLVGLREFFYIAKKKGLDINIVLGLTFGAMFPLAYNFPGEIVIMLAAMLCIFLYNFHRRLKEQALVNTAVTMFGIIYVSWFFSYTVKIRLLPNGPSWIFFVILVTKLGDTAAYLAGQRFGRTKFIQHISPNKTMEGAVGSLLASLIAALASKVYLPHITFIHLATLGVVLGILAQVGDLCESLIKRDCGVKDSGQIPGLGGVLDVLDSLIFTVPFAYYYIVAFPGFLK